MHNLTMLNSTVHECSQYIGTVLLIQGNRQQSRVKKYILCAHELGKCKSEGGTTPPLARKLPRTYVIINIGRHSTNYNTVSASVVKGSVK
jgi:hypothetical protein